MKIIAYPEVMELTVIRKCFCLIPSLWVYAKNKVEDKINKENAKCQIHEYKISNLAVLAKFC